MNMKAYLITLAILLPPMLLWIAEGHHTPIWAPIAALMASGGLYAFLAAVLP